MHRSHRSETMQDWSESGRETLGWPGHSTLQLMKLVGTFRSPNPAPQGAGKLASASG